ncbi:hypothetical protein [Halorubellus sp. PRR65]|uniref:hypothetical protein n=1 Tax=Halorubellus sp. PRR65 TaxID=3098148 RepID=UPI002B2575F4|nr:hypothetical protein [Halorubellus sp. PRR65]
METRIMGHDERGLGVEVYDPNGDRHTFELDWDGNIEKHGQDVYPKDPAKRTDEEERLMQQVCARAVYAAHVHFEDRELISTPSWVPAELERAMDIVRTLPTETFVEHFRNYFDAVRDHTGERIDDDVQGVERVRMYIHIDDDNRFIGSSAPTVRYKDASGESQATNYDVEGHPTATSILLSLPPLEFQRDDFEFPDSFQALMVSHLMCQIRDVYLNMGEEPPVEYQVEGIGKPVTLHDGLVSRPDE